MTTGIGSGGVAGQATSDTLTILHVASEMAPFAKTGGLADVVAALPTELARLGHDVTVVIPRYREVQSSATLAARLTVTLGPRGYDAGFYAQAIGERLRVVFVDCPELYDRDGLYGTAGGDHPDNPTRFGFLARAALEFAQYDQLQPSLVHAHDWQAGLVPVLLATEYADVPAWRQVATVFTIHNLAYQGTFPNRLDHLGLSSAVFHPDGLEFWGGISFLKGGVRYSDIVTTVSPRYSREILTREYGFGFEGVVGQRGDALVGILNGIDPDRWNPEADPHIPEPYSVDRLGGKIAAKRELLGRFKLPADPAALSRPVIGMVSRLVDQKGFDLLAQLGDRLAELGATIVLLGTGDPAHEAFWIELAARHPTVVAARIEFDEALAHLIEAGSDMFLMPSRFEPCGLNQMYSLRYGTVPIVRETGGLADTVEDYAEGAGSGTGFTFEPYEAEAVEAAVERAVATFADKSAWRGLQRRGMREDHSWNASAREYVKVYERARAESRAGRAGSARPSSGR